MRVNTNYSSLVAQRYLSKANKTDDKEFTRLSSGDKIAQASYDPAGLAISEKLKARLRTQNQLKRNINDGISLVQVAEGTLGSMSEVGIRLRQLAIQASSDTMQDSERSLADKEFHALKEEFKRVTESAKFNGNYILKSDSSYDLHVGENNVDMVDKIKYDLSKVFDAKGNFGLDKVNLRTKLGAQNSIQYVDKMIEGISKSRAIMGSAQNRLIHMYKNLEHSEENTARTNSKIRDTDIAQTTTDKAVNNLKQRNIEEQLKIVNSRPNVVLKLIS